MGVSIKEVKKIARLAKLEFKEEEIEKFTFQMNEILNYMEQLGEINTDDIEPLYHVIEPGNVLRNDEVKPSYLREEILKNAPVKSDGFIIVPRVIE
ncbi:MAG: Asp-tRNA(Asn)/Glu-tRNA(Gln) amidotransferase subunit GatC [Candidatus Helarchaeota archaeon]|nr:Asp-tRNA(Asn)/Glu-tRNA(Gln) amidotransferase subunit GatC [Candidatus Helarchaeota archaeon]